ncbi:unnamed protein product [Gongylonema pulchrum]|uniref:GIT2 n=1 Tax=Gongylonema pulchrum TaxID=637853 RepID=A0A183E2G1_9BILA|nr:unnamed protein product [Gongylonema pulchrum]
MRTLQGLDRTLKELENQCQGIAEATKVLLNALKAQLNEADLRRAQIDEHAPFSSSVVDKLRAEIQANKHLANEASTMILNFNKVVTQSDGICKDARILMNSLVFEEKANNRKTTVPKMAPNGEASGDISDDDSYDDTVCEATRHAVNKGDHKEVTE